MRARIAMAALIDDECLAEFGHVEFVGAEQIYKVDLAFGCTIENAGHVAALDEAEIERGNTARCRMQHIESIPAAFGDRARGADHAGVGSDPCSEFQYRSAIGARQRAGAEDQHRALGVFQNFRKCMCSVRDCLQNVRAAPNCSTGYVRS